MGYRKDIQIIRGISVLLVVLYHFDIVWFKSGFLGVDVFFVVSGFLMAVLYDPTRKREFFIKRMKRLLPAYFVIVLAVLLLSIIIVSPNEYNSIIKQVVYASVFIPNIGYWLQGSYFSKNYFNPLLHLWSLGVEIQFYLFLPLLYWLFKKIKGSYFFVLISSLILCFFVVEYSARTSFFMMPLRLWEFLIGYGVARRFKKPVINQDSITRWLGMVFLFALICIPLFPVDSTAESFIYGHPGIIAFIVCLLTAGVLIVGLPPVFESLRISNILESLGDYSYSIYMVHFPVIVLFLYQPFSGTILKSTSMLDVLAITVMIFILSYVMHNFVENRFRVNGKAHLVVLYSLLVIIILAPLGSIFQEHAYSEKEMLVFRAWDDRSEYRCGVVKRMLDPLGVTCNITDGVKQPIHRVLLVGDSHADSIKTIFSSVAEENNVSVRFVVGNEPMKGGITASEIVNEAVLQKTDSIVVHFSPDAIISTKLQRLVSLAGEHGIFVGFIMPVPTWPESVPKLLWQNMEFGRPLPIQTRQDYESRNHELVTDLSQIATKNFKVYPIVDLFCTDICQMVDDSGKPLYADGGHLTLTGSELLRNRFDEIISDLINLRLEFKSE